MIASIEAREYHILEANRLSRDIDRARTQYEAEPLLREYQRHITWLQVHARGLEIDQHVIAPENW